MDYRTGDEAPGEHFSRPDRRGALPGEPQPAKDTQSSLPSQESPLSQAPERPHPVLPQGGRTRRPTAQGPGATWPGPAPYGGQPSHPAQNPHAARPPQPSHPQQGPPPRPEGPPPWAYGYPAGRPYPEPARPAHPSHAPRHAGPVGPSWPPPGPRPRASRHSDKAKAVLIAACAAACLALIALVAGVVTVANTPQEQSSPGGADLSTYRDGELFARPSPVEVDLVEHPLYDVATPPPVDCELPPLDVDANDSWEAFSQEALDCLDALWAPVLDELRLARELPEVTMSEQALPSDTAESFTMAYYESDRERITVVLPNVREVSNSIPSDEREVVWLALMGHEYAHHLQQATGILGVSHELRMSAGSEDDELDTLRRTELQAECMAAIGLRGLTDPEGDALEVVNRHFNAEGDLDTHGSAVSRTHWLQEGWENTTVRGCNTYGAEAERVN